MTPAPAAMKALNNSMKTSWPQDGSFSLGVGTFALGMPFGFFLSLVCRSGSFRGSYLVSQNYIVMKNYHICNWHSWLFYWDHGFYVVVGFYFTYLLLNCFVPGSMSLVPASSLLLLWVLNE